jgi:hypothetical protein
MPLDREREKADRVRIGITLKCNAQWLWRTLGKNGSKAEEQH